MKATPFLLIEDNTVKGYGHISPKSLGGSGDYWLVQFNGPGRRYGKILPTAALTQFLVFSSQEELDAFIAPPPAPPAPPAPPEEKKTEETILDAAKRAAAEKQAIDALRREFGKKRDKDIAERREILLDSQPQVPEGNSKPAGDIA